MYFTIIAKCFCCNDNDDYDYNFNNQVKSSVIPSRLHHRHNLISHTFFLFKQKNNLKVYNKLW